MKKFTEVKELIASLEADADKFLQHKVTALLVLVLEKECKTLKI